MPVCTDATVVVPYYNLADVAYATAFHHKAVNLTTFKVVGCIVQACLPYAALGSMEFNEHIRICASTTYVTGVNC